jgi:Two component regulator propeller
MVFQAKSAARVEDFRGPAMISLVRFTAALPKLAGEPLRRLIRAPAGFLIALFLLQLTAPPAQGQRYSFHIYGHDSELDDNTVLALLQDIRGFLWVGTEGWLYRYEGSHFHLIADADGLSWRAEVRGLIQTRDGALRTLACNKVFRLQDGHFDPLSMRN